MRFRAKNLMIMAVLAIMAVLNYACDQTQKQFSIIDLENTQWQTEVGSQTTYTSITYHFYKDSLTITRERIIDSEQESKIELHGTYTFNPPTVKITCEDDYIIGFVTNHQLILDNNLTLELLNKDNLTTYYTAD